VKRAARLSIVATLLLVAGCDVHLTFAPESADNDTATVAEPVESQPPMELKSTPATAKKSNPANPAAPPRPKWVDAPPGLHGGVYETEVVVGPERSREACEAKLPPAVESAALRYVSSEFGPTDQQLDLRFATLQTKILGPTWEERVNVDGEDSVFLHAQLRFDDQLRTSWRHVIERWTTGFRTIAVVRGFGIAMGLLFIVHLILRFAPRRTPAT
jgi:hypothetical protein